MKRQLETKKSEITSKKTYFSSPLENLYEQVNEINEYYNEYCTSVTTAKIMTSCLNSPENCNNSLDMIADIKSKHKTVSDYVRLLYTSHQRQEVIEPAIRLKNRLWEISNVLEYIVEMFSQESIVLDNKSDVLKFLNGFTRLIACQDRITDCLNKGSHEELRAYKPLFDDCINQETAFLDFLKNNQDKNVVRLYFWAPTETVKELSQQLNAYLNADTENDYRLASPSN